MNPYFSFGVTQWCTVHQGIVLVCLNVSSRLANVKAVSRVSLMSFVLWLPKDNQTIPSMNLLKISAFSMTSEYGSVAIGNPERHVRKASHCGSKQQQSSHAMITLLLLVRATYMYGVVLHAHPVRGESHNQRNTTGEVATTSPPFYNEPHRSHVLCVKTELCTTFTSWSQHHLVAIGNPERHVHKASHRGSKQQ